tara:strand:+ start:1650 stop:2012 length:363 start_codon:yes stop_codon:yes gene_type:complete
VELNNNKNLLKKDMFVLVSKYNTLNKIKIEEVYTLPDLIQRARDASGLSTNQVSDIMRYNVFTVAQLVRLTGNDTDYINSKIKSGHLARCYPFPDHSEKRRSFVFVLRDENSMSLITQSL